MYSCASFKVVCSAHNLHMQIKFVADGLKIASYLDVLREGVNSELEEFADTCSICPRSC